MSYWYLFQHNTPASTATGQTDDDKITITDESDDELPETSMFNLWSLLASHITAHNYVGGSVQGYLPLNTLVDTYTCIGIYYHNE